MPWGWWGGEGFEVWIKPIAVCKYRISLKFPSPPQLQAGGVRGKGVDYCPGNLQKSISKFGGLMRLLVRLFINASFVNAPLVD